MTAYPTREAGLNAFVNEARTVFETVGATIPENVRVSIGYAPNSRTSARSRTIAVCISPAASADHHWEIFVSPHCDDDVAVFAALTHELIHASSSMKHDKVFGEVARALGLDGPLTATIAGAGWFAWATPIVESIEMPYAAIDLEARHKPKKATYLLKVECPDCGWLARVSAKHCHEGMMCPLPDCDGHLHVEAPADSDD